MGVWVIEEDIGEIGGLLFQGLDGRLYLASFNPKADRLGFYWFIDEVKLEFN